MKSPSNRPAPKRTRPRLMPISDEMKAWSAALAAELTTWPQVNTRPMFGFTAIYRGKRIFALLPRTRGMGSASSLAFKLENAGQRRLTQLLGDKRLSSTIMRATRWFVFELTSNRDLTDALDWLGHAHHAAG